MEPKRNYSIKAIQENNSKYFQTTNTNSNMGFEFCSNQPLNHSKNAPQFSTKIP